MDGSRQRLRVVAGVLGVLVAVTAVVWLLFRETDEPTEVLSDGTVVKLRGATYGKTHRMFTGSIWHRLAGRILPDRLSRRLGIPVIHYITTNDSLVVWLEVDTRAVPTKYLYSGPSVSIGDEHGSEFLSAVRTSSKTTANGFVQGYEMPLVPPGHDALTVIVHHGGPRTVGQTDARLRLRRPVATSRKATETRQPSPTSRVDNLEFVVRTVESFQTLPYLVYTKTWADCLILEDGQRTTNWMVRGVDVMDDAGRIHRASPGRDRRGRLSLDVGLSTNQIWRLRFHLGRTTGFAANDLVTVPAAPLTVSDRAAFRPVTNNVNGVSFVLYNISGFGSCRLMALVTPADDPFDVTFVRAIDDAGRELIRGEQAAGQVLPDNSRMFNFTMKATGDNKTADLTFAVTRMKSVEVFVKPTAATNVSATFLPATK